VHLLKRVFNYSDKILLVEIVLFHPFFLAEITTISPPAMRISPWRCFMALNYDDVLLQNKEEVP